MAKFNVRKQVEERTGTQDAGKINIKDIPIGEIITRKNVRQYDDIDIDDLKASIKQTGLLQPITVYKEDDDYICIIGHRRLQAYRALYKTEPDKYHSINAIITDDKNITIRQLIENVQRADLKPIELYNALKELKEQKYNYKEIAGIIGKSEGYIKNLFSGIKEMESDPENIKILKKSHDVTLPDFQIVKNIKDKDLKRNLLNQKAEKKITQSELQKKVKEINKKGKPQQKVDVQKTKSEDLNKKLILNKIRDYLKNLIKIEENKLKNKNLDGSQTLQRSKIETRKKAFNEVLELIKKIEKENK